MPRIDYGGVSLTLSDALYGDRVDREHGHWSPLQTFDPTDHARLFVQDVRYGESGLLPDIYTGWYCDVAMGVIQPRCRGTDDEFAVYARAMRDALLLPLEDGFTGALRDLWENWGLPEAERRMLAQERRKRTRVTSDWENADLVAEVELVCGEGRKEGRQIAFRCPWHQDLHPSLKVDPVKRTWFCWPCGKGGGVVGWRKANGR